MSSIKDAIIRIGRTIRHVEASSQANSSMGTESSNTIKTLSVQPRKSQTVSPPKQASPLHHSNFSNEELSKYTPLITEDYRRKYYQEFLKPLQIDNLKTFQKDRPKYDSQRAANNWKTSKSKNIESMSINYLEDRVLFLKMMDLLIELTPASLQMLGPSVSTKYIHNILTREEAQEKENQFKSEIPSYCFHEIPKLPEAVPSPSPQDKREFQRYIYFLTHSKVLYKNSSSLENGIVPDILLYTHSIENDEYKPYRSVHTFNYIIKYFGYDKNQSSFARELLLVMNKDGHKPNIDTINNLLKMCKIHANIRSLTSTYSAVIQYLKLANSLGLEVNMATWARIYDSINNIFLKEIFIDKINSISLPISKGLSLKILDDFMSTTKKEEEVIGFIENDLKCKNWQQDSMISNKVLRYQMKHTGVLAVLDAIVFNSSSSHGDRIIDEYTFQNIIHHIIFKSPELQDKLWYTMKVYLIMRAKYPHIAPNADTFKYILRGICFSSKNGYRTEDLMFLARAFIHEESTTVLELPTEFKSVTTAGGETITEGASENFKIMRLLVGGEHLNKLEGEFLFQHGHAKEAQIDVPEKNNNLLRHALSEEEKQTWNKVKSEMISSETNGLFCESKPKNNANKEMNMLKQSHLDNADLAEREQQAQKYANIHKNRSINATYRNRLERIHNGNFQYTLEKMRERNIID